MSLNTTEGDWDAWKNLVLTQLNRASAFMDNYSEDKSIMTERLIDVKEIVERKIQDMKSEITTELNNIRRDIAKVNTLIGSKIETIDMLRLWKKDTDEISILETIKNLKEWKEVRDSHLPNAHIKDMLDKIENTEKFKTKVITAMVILQIVFALIFALIQATQR